MYDSALPLTWKKFEVFFHSHLARVSFILVINIFLLCVTIEPKFAEF